MDSTPNLTLHPGFVSSEDRERLLGQRGVLVWMTGLSGSGKSTIARALEQRLFREGKLVYVLDGDNVRHGLNSDLGFSESHRQENIRRIGEVAALFVDAGIIVTTAFISPFRKDRERVRDLVRRSRFVEVYVNARIETCEKRDPKGLYEKVRRGEIPEFTGISSPYEPPDDPGVVLNTDHTSVDECVGQIIHELERRSFLSAPTIP